MGTFRGFMQGEVSFQAARDSYEIFKVRIPFSRELSVAVDIPVRSCPLAAFDHQFVFGFIHAFLHEPLRNGLLIVDVLAHDTVPGAARNRIPPLADRNLAVTFLGG